MTYNPFKFGARNAQPQVMGARIGGTAPDRDVTSMPGQPPDKPPAQEEGIVQEFDSIYPTSKKAPPKILHIITVLVPAVATNVNGEAQVHLPADYDWVGVYFPTAPAATLSFGPDAASLPVAQAGAIILPFTTRTFKFSNSNAAAYTAYIVAGQNIERPDFSFV